MPQVVIYLPDNGRDPDLVKPIPDPRVKATRIDQDPARTNVGDQRDH
jgi:hypothetical protein